MAGSEIDETAELVPCPACGQMNMRGDWAHMGGLDDYCWGCAGYPFCSCDKSHTGDCDHLKGESGARVIADCINGTLKTSPKDNGESDPIADLRAACERIQAEAKPKPDVILMHKKTWDRMIEMIRTWIERYEAILRKPLLSGCYGKRRRQRAEGVAKYRHERRQEARWELESLRWRLREMTTEA